MSTITVPSEDLVAALTAVLPHAGVDDTLPILTCVHFETRDGGLALATTDRYTLGTYRLDAEITDELDGANLVGRDAKDLLAFAKKAKRIPLTLVFDGRELTVTDFERKATYTLYDGEFPKVWAVLPERDADRTVVGINPVNFARLAKATDPKRPEHVRIEIGSPVKVMRVEVGERFVGAIMPVRLPDEAKVTTHVTGDGAEHPTEDAALQHAGKVAADTGHVVAVEKVEPEVESPVSPDEPADDEHTQWHESEVELADDPMAEEEGAETTPDWCTSCKGFGVVRGVGSKAGQPYKTANGAATATTSVECPTCHGDKIAAA
jgi:hypothetical protein